MTTSVEFTLGAESVTVPLDIQTGDETILTGDIGGLIAAGTTARLRGNCRLVADLHVRGTLLCDESGVDLDGQNLFDIHTHDGTLNLVGVEKTAWARWGDVVVGWQIGDRLAVAPTAVGVFVSTEITWQGSWAATPRPANSPDVTLVDGSIARPEVANLSQTNTFRNLKRTMIHEASAPNPQTLKWIRFLNCGVTGELTMYPIHFHLIGDHARGSLLEGVVVEGGRNHAFVPHASHGITFTGCVAYKTTDDAYWWDAPLNINHTANNTNDNVYDHCLALGGSASSAGISVRLTGFQLLAGSNNRCLNCVTACINGGNQSSGFSWPEHSGANVGGAAWQFDDCLAHNNSAVGLFNWQNDHVYEHLFNRFTSYRNGRGGVISGAYRNDAKFRHVTSTQDGTGSNPHSKAATFGFAKSERPDAILYEDYLTDNRLFIAHAPVPATKGDVVARRATWTGVTVQAAETDISWRFEDCGLLPVDFTIDSLGPLSVLKIVESGVEIHKWQSGVWS